MTETCYCDVFDYAHKRGDCEAFVAMWEALRDTLRALETHGLKHREVVKARAALALADAATGKERDA